MNDFLWSIFGNDEQPQAPDSYHPLWPRWRRQLGWLFWRNPAHNLLWHKWGIVDTIHEWIVSGNYPEHVWNPNGGWNRLLFTHKITETRHKYFVSYRGDWIEGYIGVRYNGSYGFAMRRVGS